jgi:hypothetical protein
MQPKIGRCLNRAGRSTMPLPVARRRAAGASVRTRRPAGRKHDAEKPPHAPSEAARGRAVAHGVPTWLRRMSTEIDTAATAPSVRATDRSNAPTRTRHSSPSRDRNRRSRHFALSARDRATHSGSRQRVAGDDGSQPLSRAGDINVGGRTVEDSFPGRGSGTIRPAHQSAWGASRRYSSCPLSTGIRTVRRPGGGSDGSREWRTPDRSQGGMRVARRSPRRPRSSMR